MDEERDIYSREGEIEMAENDEIRPEEAAFMEGYNSKDLLECSECGKTDIEKPVEREVNGEMLTFCSEKCADKFAEENEE